VYEAGGDDVEGCGLGGRDEGGGDVSSDDSGDVLGDGREGVGDPPASAPVSEHTGDTEPDDGGDDEVDDGTTNCLAPGGDGEPSCDSSFLHL
jgi:hypothetical protein